MHGFAIVVAAFLAVGSAVLKPIRQWERASRSRRSS
jgi:hypothetical protein